MATEIIQTTPDCEIISTRTFSVPQKLLFKAWSTPEQLKNWWGPAGFTSTFHEFDFRVGGHWRFTMHGPDKGNYENACEYIKIEEYSLIAWKRHSHPLFQVVATFEEVAADQTTLVFRMLFEDPDLCRKIKAFAVDKNEENFDKLERELAQMTI